MTSDYVPRSADTVLALMLTEHPAIMVTGPRAAGKTTSAIRLAHDQLNLAREQVAQAVRSDPMVALTGKRSPLLVDEWQVVPQVLADMKTVVDTDSRPGQFIVTGSVRGEIDSPTWPGTGRLVMLPLYGLTEREIERQLGVPSWFAQVLGGEIPQVSTEENLAGYIARALRSGFPQPALQLSTQAQRDRWLASYIDHVVGRDIPELGHYRDTRRVRRYLEALALHSAGTIDDATLFAAAGIAKDTARDYERLLNNLLIVDYLPAWSSNRLKRLTLMPKRYLVDPALLAAVLGVTSNDVLSDGNLLGRVLETFVVAQLRAECSLLAPMPRMHHLRTQRGEREIDIVIEVGHRKLIAIEIKSTSAPKSDDVKHLRWFQESIGDDLIAAIVLHTGPTTFSLGNGIMACPIASLWS